MSPILRLDGARDVYARNALASAADTFVTGGSGQANIRQAPSIATPTLGPEIFDADSTVPLLHRVNRSAEVGLLYSSPSRSLGSKGKLWLEGEATVGRVESTYLLPDGLGILTDPMTISFRSTTVTPMVRLVYAHPLGASASSNSIFGYVGAGQQYASTSTTVSSALIALSDKSRTSHGFGVLGAGVQGKWLGPDGPDTRLSASTTVTAGQGLWTTVGIELRQ